MRFKSVTDTIRSSPLKGGAYVALVVGAFAGIVTLIFGVLAVQALVLKLAWNYVIPVIFASLPVINFWQGFSLVLVSNILFKTVDNATSDKK
jgi:hypothetical protein